MSQAESTAAVRVFPVDVEHMGIRLALPIMMVVGFVGLFAIFSQPIDDFVTLTAGTIGGTAIVTFAVALVGALLIGALGDRLLKRVWPSGRTVALADSNGTLTLRDGRRGHRAAITFDLNARINVLSWRFTVRRSSPRAAHGWHMVACQLTQDEHQVILYTFVPPKVATESRYVAFHPLADPRDKAQLTLRETAEQRRLLAAETTRGEDGAELRPADFAEIVAALASHLDTK